MNVNLGNGTLTWTRFERTSDRYGTVFLIQNGLNSMSECSTPSLVIESAARLCDGLYGKLMVEIIGARQSTHIGDLFRNVRPRTPKVGDVIILGTGTFFFEKAPDGGWQVGLRNPRETDWMDVRALYDAHEQTVNLFFASEQERV